MQGGGGARDAENDRQIAGLRSARLDCRWPKDLSDRERGFLAEGAGIEPAQPVGWPPGSIRAPCRSVTLPWRKVEESNPYPCGYPGVQTRFEPMLGTFRIFGGGERSRTSKAFPLDAFRERCRRQSACASAIVR